MTNRRSVWRAAKVLTFLGATYWLALPQVGRAWSGVRLMNDRGLFLPILGGLFALGAVWAYAQVTRMLFEKDERPGPWLTLGIVVAGLGVNRLVPAGTAAGSIVAFRLYRRFGVGRQRTGFVMAAQGLGSNLLLVFLVAVAMVIALPVHGIAPGYVTAAVVGSGLLGSVILVTDGVWHDRQWLHRLVRRVGRGLEHFWSGLGPNRLDELLNSIRLQAGQLAARPSDARSALAWGTANWLLDAASLWVFLSIAGTDVAPQTAVVVFGLANLAGLLPMTPGGLGVVDLTMTAALAGLGAPAEAAVIGVAGYRLSHYWLPIPAAACAYLLVRRHLARRVRTSPCLA
ncbi:MAG: YbhN family protein [Acidimicrobiales bacterium]